MKFAIPLVVAAASFRMKKRRSLWLHSETTPISLGQPGFGITVSVQKVNPAKSGPCRIGLS
jgi:hypothetical protein